MGFYDRYILPPLINMACSSKPNMKQREKVIPLAEGEVLEIGEIGREVCCSTTDCMTGITAPCLEHALTGFGGPRSSQVVNEVQENHQLDGFRI